MKGSASGFVEFLQEQMAGFGPVTARRMFGGSGLYRDGLIFALVAEDTLYLKADAQSKAAFEAEGLEPFTFATKNGGNTLTSYWRAPERCLEDIDEMAEWCGRAYDVALKAAGTKLTRR